MRPRDNSTRMEALVKEVSKEFSSRLSLIFGNKYEDMNREEFMQIVETEVLSLVKSGQVIENLETVARLEEQVQSRLQELQTGHKGGQTRPSLSETEDEWDLLARYETMVKKKEEESRRDELRKKKENQKAEIAAQISLTKQRKQQELEAKQAEQKKINADVDAWRLEQFQNREKRRSEAAALRVQREAQLDDLMKRRHLATMLQRASDAYAEEQATEQSRKEAVAEKEYRKKAKKDLEKVFEANRKAEEARLEAKRLEREMDLKYMREYAEMLDRHEEEHRSRLQKVKERQRLQEMDAATRPPLKKWIDEDIISKQAADVEAKVIAKEKERTARAIEARQACNAEIKNQILNHKKIVENIKREKKKDLEKATTLAAEAAQEQRENARLAKASRSKFRADLDNQIKRKNAMKPRSGMNAVEKKINSKILKEAKAAMSTKKL